MNIPKIFGQIGSEQAGQMVEQLVSQEVNKRHKWERRWYDNNFFDDGYHFRAISKKTGRVIDTLGKLTGYVERAIPRASLQIRGISNLLFAAEPYPVIYPKRITVEDFRNPTTKEIDLAKFQEEQKKLKEVARKQGVWVSTEWEENELPLKLIDMILLAAKNSVSYLQIYTDDDQKMCFDVYDAFDIILQGDMRDIQDVPFITKACPTTLAKIKEDSRFDPAMVAKLQPDNKYATSEIKDAYQRARFGMKTGEKELATIINKETFIKETLTEANWEKAVKKDAGGSMEGKSKGDMIMRHIFSAGGVTLGDEYINYDDYPFADFRFEPGPLYQIPLIERFIPQNKSIDIIMTRLEKWVNAMVVGVYQKRKGENFQLSNFPGGQVLEYETTPLSQMNQSSVGATPFNVIQLLDKYLEEQGATTSALGQLPNEVKSGKAIESLKSSEYANLKIATLMLKKTLKRTTKLMLERADKDYLEPKEVEYMNDSEPDYFDVIGQTGINLSEKVNKDLPSDVVPLDKSVKVRIEIEPGLGLTQQGKREAMSQIVELMTGFAKNGLLGPEPLKIVVKNFLETFGYGSTQELIEAMENSMGEGNLDENAITKTKIALAEVLKDLDMVGPKADEKLVMASKVGTLESLKDAGMIDGINKGKPKEVSKSISFKDLPTEGKVQLAGQAGITLNPDSVEAKTEEDKQSKYPINKFKKNNLTT